MPNPNDKNPSNTFVFSKSSDEKYGAARAETARWVNGNILIIDLYWVNHGPKIFFYHLAKFVSTYLLNFDCVFANSEYIYNFLEAHSFQCEIQANFESPS